MTRIEIEFKLSGPIVDGRADAAGRAFTKDLREDLALGHGVVLVSEMQRVFRHPTPIYWSTIEVVHRSANTDVVTDRGRRVYNFWLAGCGSKNFPITVFRGYRHWEIAERRTNVRFWPLANQKLHRYLARMEG